MRRDLWTSPALIAALAILPVAVPGCMLGHSIASVGPAHSPLGVSVTVHARAGFSFKGELLVLADSGLLMFVDHRLVFAYAEAIERVRPGSGASEVYVEGAQLQTNAAAQALIPLSRFPAGITSQVLSEMLHACSQEMPEPVRARPAR